VSQIGDHCLIDHHAVVRTGVTMGSGNHVDCHSVLGGRPQDLKYNPPDLTDVVIGNNNIFREGVTTTPDGTTRIGSGCYLMSHAHLAHDCTLEDGVILATGVALTGHVEVGTCAFIGGGTMAHQWTQIDAYAMVAGLLAVRKDVLPDVGRRAGPPLSGESPGVESRRSQQGSLRGLGPSLTRATLTPRTTSLRKSLYKLVWLHPTIVVGFRRSWTRALALRHEATYAELVEAFGGLENFAELSMLTHHLCPQVRLM